MRNIVYYVATSLDGFISGPNDDIDGFVYGGNGVDKYLNDLKAFDTVMMGRKTYEFGYKFGVEPGQPSPTYQHMSHVIFSDTLRFPERHPQVQIKKLNIEEIEDLKRGDGADIYLCGGGQLAGWLLDHGQIDILKVKLNPLILGSGTPVFGDSKRKVRLNLADSTTYDGGLQIITYRILY